MTAIDATGLHALEVFSAKLRKTGRTLLICGAREQPARMLDQAEFVRLIGQENILPNVGAALVRAKEIHDGFDGLGNEIADDLRRAAL
jgi:SulP family sulfate permease